METQTSTGTSTGQTPPAAPTPTGASSGQDPKAAAMGYLAKLEAWLDDVMIKKAPFQIPMGGKEFLATIAPYLVIIGIVLFVVSLPALLGLGAMMGTLGMMTGAGWGYTAIVGLLSSVAAMILEAMAVSGLFHRTQKSWRLMFYASVVSVAGSVLALNLIGAVLSALIGWYIIFQMKEMYKN